VEAVAGSTPSRSSLTPRHLSLVPGRAIIARHDDVIHIVDEKVGVVVVLADGRGNAAAIQALSARLDPRLAMPPVDVLIDQAVASLRAAPHLLRAALFGDSRRARAPAFAHAREALRLRHHPIVAERVDGDWHDLAVDGYGLVAGRTEQGRVSLSLSMLLGARATSELRTLHTQR